MQPVNRSKEELKLAADALFLELEADYGKKPKQPSPKKQVASRPPTTSEGHEANIMASLMSANSSYKAVAQVSHVVRQTCSCCLESIEYIGNQTIRFDKRASHESWYHVLPIGSPEIANLPHEVVEFSQKVDKCSKCVRHEIDNSSLPKAPQLNLFH